MNYPRAIAICCVWLSLVGIAFFDSSVAFMVSFGAVVATMFISGED